MSLADITAVDIGRRPRKRVGRGLGSGLGKTCGRGYKGEGARAGGPNRGPLFEGGQKPLYMRIPKRGFSNHPHRQAWQVLRLDIVLKHLSGPTIDAAALAAAGLAKVPGPPIKLVGGRGALEVPRPLTVAVDRVSAAVKAAITAAGGSVAETRPAAAEA